MLKTKLFQIKILKFIFLILYFFKFNFTSPNEILLKSQFINFDQTINFLNLYIDKLEKKLEKSNKEPIFTEKKETNVQNILLQALKKRRESMAGQENPNEEEESIIIIPEEEKKEIPKINKEKKELTEKQKEAQKKLQEKLKKYKNKEKSKSFSELIKEGIQLKKTEKPTSEKQKYQTIGPFTGKYIEEMLNKAKEKKELEKEKHEWEE